MTSTENGAEPLLRLKGVSKNFGPVQALAEVDFEIQRAR
jgi:ABC-type sugar transport system ATPase subunit